MSRVPVYLTKNGPAPAPASDEIALVADANGVVKSLTSAGALANVGGGDAGTLITAAANPTSVALWSGRSGDTDGSYELRLWLTRNGAVNALYTLQPNSLATNQVGIEFVGGTGNTSLTDMRVLRLDNAASETDGYAYVRFHARTGRVRVMEVDWQKYNSGAIVSAGYTRAIWTVTATDITSMTLVSSAANGIATGSLISWRVAGWTA